MRGTHCWQHTGITENQILSLGLELTSQIYPVTYNLWDQLLKPPLSVSKRNNPEAKLYKSKSLLNVLAVIALTTDEACLCCQHWNAGRW